MCYLSIPPYVRHKYTRMYTQYPAQPNASIVKQSVGETTLVPVQLTYIDTESSTRNSVCHYLNYLKIHYKAHIAGVLGVKQKERAGVITHRRFANTMRALGNVVRVRCACSYAVCACVYPKSNPLHRFAQLDQSPTKSLAHAHTHSRKHIGIVCATIPLKFGLRV